MWMNLYLPFCSQNLQWLLGVFLWVKMMGITKVHSCSLWSKGMYQRTSTHFNTHLPFYFKDTNNIAWYKAEYLHHLLDIMQVNNLKLWIADTRETKNNCFCLVNISCSIAEMTPSFKFSESAVAQGHIRILHSDIGKLNFPISIFFSFKSRSH
jgi:hypothetical protein